MPHTLSAKKSLRQAAARHTANRAKKRDIATRSKRLLAAIEAKDFDTAETILSGVVSKIDKARKANVIHANKAARLKARLARLLNRARASG